MESHQAGFGIPDCSSRTNLPNDEEVKTLGLGIDGEGSASRSQAVPEHVVEITLRVDFFPCDFKGITNAAKFDGLSFFVENHVARAAVAIPRLTHTSDVHHRFLGAEFISVVATFWRNEVPGLGENSWHVRMPLKTEFLQSHE